MIKFTKTDFMLKFFMRKNLFKLFFLLVFFTETSHANFIDTKWKVSNVVGETWFSKSENIIGKYQEFYKGFSEGVFYSCDYAGQSATYNVYNLNEFLSTIWDCCITLKHKFRFWPIKRSWRKKQSHLFL